MAKFFGECNLINCRVVDEDTKTIKINSGFGNFILPKNTNLSRELEFVYGIRPEEVKFFSDNLKLNSIDSFDYYYKSIELNVD